MFLVLLAVTMFLVLYTNPLTGFICIPYLLHLCVLLFSCCWQDLNLNSSLSSVKLWMLSLKLFICNTHLHAFSMASVTIFPPLQGSGLCFRLLKVLFIESGLDAFCLCEKKMEKNTAIYYMLYSIFCIVNYIESAAISNCHLGVSPKECY